jgi:hypothetical protein
MKNSTATWIKIIGDTAIPLLGFFLWDWTIYFIALFLLLDLTASETGFLLKFRLMLHTKKWTPSKTPLFSSLLTAFAIALAFAGLFVLFPDKQLTNEIHEFIFYEDMGIAQGYILIPLIGIMAFQELKLFKRQSEMLVIDQAQFCKKHLQQRAILCVLLAIGLAVSFFQPTELIVLSFLLISMAVVQRLFRG